MGNCCCKQHDNNFLISKCLYCGYETKNSTKLNKHMTNCKYNYSKSNLSVPFIL